MYPDKAKYKEYERRRRWALLVFEVLSIAVTLFLGVPTWALALGKGTGFAVGSLGSRLMRPVQEWFDRTRLAQVEGEPKGVLRYPWSALIISSLYTGFFLILAMLELVGFVLFLQIAGFPQFALIFIGFGTFLFLFAAAYFSLPVAGYYCVRHQADPTQFRYQTFFTEGVVGWNEIKRVGYSQRLQSFRIETSDGTVVRISAMLTGLPEFAVAVLRFVPWCCVDKTARLIIKRTACRNLPRVLV